MHRQIINQSRHRLIMYVMLCIIFMACIPAAAESVIFRQSDAAYFFENENLNEGWSIYEGILMADGETAYCIEPKETAIIGEDRYETGTWDTYNDYPEDIKDRITEYTCFGYGNQGMEDDEYWYATQLLIWKTINPAFENTRVYKDPSYAGDLNRSAAAFEITDVIKARMAEIEQKVNEYHRQVDPVYTIVNKEELTVPLCVKAGAQVMIHDRADVLKDYRLMNEDTRIVQNGSDVLIDTRSAQSIHAVFHYNGIPESIKSAPLVLKARDGSKIQTLIIRGSCTVKSFEVQIDVIPAKLRIIKHDSLSKDRPQNGASFKNAQYELRNETENTVIGTFAVNEEGCSEIIGALNMADTYSLHETAAPKGYQLDEQIHTFRLSDLAENDGVYEIEMSDCVISGRIAIHKVIANRMSSDLCVNEKGARFAVLSAHSIASYGSFDEALQHYDEINDMEKALIVTDENGYGESGELAFGAYTVRQIEASAADLELCSDFTFSIEKETEKPLLFEVSNIPAEYHLKIIKKDAENGRLITRTPAVFQIFTEDGRCVKQKIGSAEYDTFMCASDEQIKTESNVYKDTSSEPGTLVLPLSLPAGSYELREVSAPYGYRISETAIPVVIGSTAMENADGSYVEVSVANEPLSGSLQVRKTVAQVPCDTDLIPSDLSGIIFSLCADEEIRSCQDGSLLYEKGSEVSQLHTDSAGYAEMTDLPFGDYVLREIQTPGWLICSAEEYRFTIGTETVKAEINVENRPVTTVFSKKQASGSDELCGAHLCVMDMDGTVVDEWISANTPHVIKGLSKDQTYILRETIAPLLDEGSYVKAEEIRFTPQNDVNGLIEMRNGIVRIEKYNEADQPLADAFFEVIDEHGEIVDSWQSSEHAHIVKNLNAAEVYTLRETSAPQGYYCSYDTEFTPESGKDLTIRVNDAPIRVKVSKIEESTGKPLEGVTLTLYEECEDEEVQVVSWKTGTQAKQIGPYLKAGRVYRLEESEAVNGVYRAADLCFTIDQYDPLSQEDVNIVMIDAAVRLAAVKSDESGSFLSGARLALCDEAGNVLHEWVTQNRLEDLSSYVSGEGTYVLKEIQAPKGYALSDPLVFTVKGNSAQRQILRMIDRNVRVHLCVKKTDSETGDPLAGAEITVYHSSDNTEAALINGRRAKGITSENGEVSFILPYDPQGYYVRETKAPKGYSINKSRFDLSEDSENNPPVIFEQITISDSRNTVPTGIANRTPVLLWAGVALALITVIAQCVNGYCGSHRRRH